MKEYNTTTRDAGLSLIKCVPHYVTLAECVGAGETRERQRRDYKADIR